ncbi:TonB-dependent receptor [Steroidobacter sp. S1-65]|uniref:TonB-dependent receptor n=1 Tax=Steroidobacter gossypii TaxID=2805490 RepID=A0ABS1X0G7_9GAMM|nr:TonB-dependent receptor [Steroidobacter gossypii]MBM0106698.1 TonB-dependent receptor [Steroidobacter gossypii]
MNPQQPGVLKRYVMFALALQGAAFTLESNAQDQSTAAPPQEEVVVTGSRITRSEGYEAPTPLTVLSQEQLFGQSANSSVRESLSTMPVFSGGYDITTGAGVPSFNQAGLSTIEMRNLGITRTLVLLDGQRSVGSIATGVVDTDNFPQQLIERVEVVTGGASAVYGSDAVAGVVNFILDRDFTGFKGELSGGSTDRGDAENYKLALAAGFPFAGGRGHVLLSGEMVDNDGIIHGTNRDWGRTTRNYIVNPAYNGTNGQPEFLLRNDVFLSQATHGGLITSGPLRGTAFGEGGVPYQFNYGEGVTRDLFMSGGDYLSTRTDDAFSLLPEQERENIFGRVSYDISDNLNVFLQVSRGVSSTYGIAFPHYQAGAGPTVLSGNPFIPAEVQARMTELGLASFRLGTMNYDMPFVATETTRAANRYVLGAEGDFDLIGANWSWNSYAQLGETKSQHYTHNARIVANYNRALDVIRDPTTGDIVCRSTLANPTDGCVPWNPMGLGVNSEAARDYILGTAFSEQTTRQEVVAASVTGEPFRNWAGPVSLALSAEYRKEEATVNPDEIARRSGWHSGNHQLLDAGYHVVEAAIETLIPLLSNRPLVDAWDLSAAYRATDYEVSGSVSTWKIGTTYAMTPGLRFRATVSRDIRAPNISELFQAQNFGLVSTFDPLTNTTPTHGRTQSGNPNLKPEEADSLTVGVVMQPSFAPGLSVSVDYWDVDIKDAIQLIGGSDIITLCYRGYDILCPRITRNSEGVITTVEQGNFNFASQQASGIDIEASYSFALSSLIDSWVGNMTLRLMGTHYIENISNDGFTEPDDSVGTVDGTPETVLTGSISYDLSRFSSTLTTRYFSDVVMDNDYIVCRTDCPTSTTFARTFDQLGIDGGLYFDLSVAYRFDSLFNAGAEGRVYFNVRNLTDEDPELTPALGTTGLGYIYSRSNGGRWDKLGRVYRLGMDFKF